MTKYFEVDRYTKSGEGVQRLAIAFCDSRVVINTDSISMIEIPNHDDDGQLLSSVHIGKEIILVKRQDALDIRFSLNYAESHEAYLNRND